MKKKLLCLSAILIIVGGCSNKPETVDLEGTIEAVVSEKLSQKDYVTNEELEESQLVQNKTVQAYIGNQIHNQSTEAPVSLQNPSGTIMTVTPSVNILQDENCTNKFEYLSDINIPDGADIPIETVFPKTWFIKNVGTCTWNSKYKLVYNSGNLKGLSDSYNILEEGNFLRPGETISVSARMQAPSITNTAYESYWQLESDKGELFGAGDQQNVMLSAKIKTSTFYNFVSNFNSAICSDDYGYFTCGTHSDGSRGSAFLDQTPMTESGSTGNVAFVITPPHTEGGKTRVEFGPLRIPVNHRFYTSFSCRPQTPQCDTQLRLYVREEGRAEEYEIKSSREWNDGFMSEWEFKMGDFGYSYQDLYYIFEVIANGGGDSDDEIMFMNTRFM